MSKLLKSSLLFVAAGALSTAAIAHTGHETHAFIDGLAHPFGLDHLLAMMAVGIWSVSVLPAHRQWQGPATFMLAMVIGAILGGSGITIPYLEHSIALSVSLFGVMLTVPKKHISNTFGLVFIVLAASLHGLAHGAETPETGFAGYAVGFSLTTMMLHLFGIGLGLNIRRGLGARGGQVLTSLGGGLGIVGVYIFGQI